MTCFAMPRSVLWARSEMNDLFRCYRLPEWTALGKPLRSRQAAILAVANLDKKNKNITSTLVSYLHEPYFDVNFWVFYALGTRGDPDAIGFSEDLLKEGDLSMGERSVIERQITALKSGGAKQQ